MKKIIIYDTSDYENFPIGGQLTSIRNFLRYIAEEHPEDCIKFLLVGVTTKMEEIGVQRKIMMGEKEFSYLPVLYRNKELNKVHSSMRMAFLKALFRFKKQIPSGKDVIHYLHTPEAFIQIKMCHPFAKTVIFSHGSFFNMVKGFRFFTNNKVVGVAFEQFIKLMLKQADLIFVLDEDSRSKYKKYNKNVIKVNNSIVLPSEDYSQRRLHNPVRLLFVGRLSKVKRIDEIIKAVETSEQDLQLTVVGDGEEREYLQSLVKTDRVHFIGAVKPCEVKEQMRESDILVMNSLIEGKPMTIIEAMSFGLPIITTNVGGISELVEFGENAVETDGKQESINIAIKYVCNTYMDYSVASHKIALSFDFHKVNKKIYDNFEHL